MNNNVQHNYVRTLELGCCCVKNTEISHILELIKTIVTGAYTSLL